MKKFITILLISCTGTVHVPPPIYVPPPTPPPVIFNDSMYSVIQDSLNWISIDSIAWIKDSFNFGKPNIECDIVVDSFYVDSVLVVDQFNYCQPETMLWQGVFTVPYTDSCYLDDSLCYGMLVGNNIVVIHNAADTTLISDGSQTFFLLWPLNYLKSNQ